MKNFCVLPFYSMEIGVNNAKNIYCCRLKHGTKIEEVRDSIGIDQRHDSCSTCWNLEDQGLISERIIHNRTFDHYLDRDIAVIEKQALSGQYKPQIIKLGVSNICNGTCITCNSTYSSAWAHLENKKKVYWSNPD